MTSISFKALRIAVANVLNGFGGLHGYPKLPNTVNLPAAVVVPSAGQFYVFDTTLERGTDDVKLTILLLVSTALTENAQDQLDDFLPGGANNIKALLEGNLNGQVEYLTVDVVQDWSLHMVAGAQYFGIQILCSIGVEPAS